MSSFVVTGAAGFIGSHLVDRLLSQGHDVVGVDNLSLGKRTNLESAFQNKKFDFYECDLNDLSRFQELVSAQYKKSPIDTIWHMAANSDIRAASPRVDLENTFMTTFHVLEVMRTLKIPNLAFASTSAVYGECSSLLTESTGPLFPISYYGAMKLSSEAIISTALHHYLKNAWIFRFPNVTGSRATHGIIYDFILKLKSNPQMLAVLGNGAQEKPYLHVSELLDAMFFIQQKTAQPLYCFNIGPKNSTTTTVRYIAEKVVHFVSPSATIQYTGSSRGWPGDVPKFNYSIQHLQNLGWSPGLSSNESVDLAIQECKKDLLSSR